MITQVQILPSIYQLQRLGIVGEISICALNSTPLRTLVDNQALKKSFPDQGFTAYPSVDTDPEKNFPDISKEVIAKMPEHSVVVVRCRTSCTIRL